MRLHAPILLPLLLLFLGGAAHAAPRNRTAWWSGTDIAAYRAIAQAGLSCGERLSAYGEFVGHYPRSPLAEVALGLLVAEGGQVEQVLSGLDPQDRAYLVSRFRSHREQLARNPAESPPITQADPAVRGGEHETRQTDRAINTSSR